MSDIVRLPAVFALACVAAVSSSHVDRLAGHYSRPVSTAEADGPWRGEQVVEIAQVNATRVFFTIDLPASRHKRCAISGTARREGNTLVYRETQRDFDRPVFCELHISTSGESLTINDRAGTCYSWCSEGLSLGNVRLPLGSKRRIASLSKLRASQEYRSAIADWKAGKVR